MNISAETDIQLTARFLPPIVNNQGVAGDGVPIVATLLDRNGAIPGAEVFGVKGFMLGYVEKPYEAGEWILLIDDGAHNDGAFNDGIYGGEFIHTYWGGTYNVTLFAFLKDEASGEVIEARRGRVVSGSPDRSRRMKPIITTRTRTACPTPGSGAAS